MFIKCDTVDEVKALNAWLKTTSQPPYLSNYLRGKYITPMYCGYPDTAAHQSIENDGSWYSPSAKKRYDNAIPIHQVLDPESYPEWQV